MKKLKTFTQLNELSKELIDKASNAMISRGQGRRASKLVNTYNDVHYDFKQFVGKPIFKGEFIRNIGMSTEAFGDKRKDVIKLFISNNQEYNTSQSTVIYFIEDDEYRYLPHKGNVTRHR